MKILSLLLLLISAANFSGKPLSPAKVAVENFGVADVSPALRLENEETIPWLAQRRLVWDDFLCAPQKQGDAVASTSTSLGISYQLKNGRLNYTITCNFSKLKSWGSLKTNYILQHEQAHFDITELHARRLYAALSDYAYNAASFKKDIADIYSRIVKEKEAMQEAYDGETDHSRRKQVQLEWLGKINTMLMETEAFAAYP